MRFWLLLCICILATGCSMKTIYNPEPKWPWKDKPVCTKQIDTPNDCTLIDVVTAYNLALNYCIDYSNMYEDGGDIINNSRFAISMLGTLSGAVFAPIAGGSAKDAWSGLSGSTNALQSSLNESFSSAINIRRRLEITGAGATAKRQVSDGKDHLNKVLASMQLAYECRMAAARADGAAIQVLSNLQGGAAVVPSDRTAAEADPEAAKAKAEKTGKEAAVTAVKEIVAEAAPLPLSAKPADKIAINDAQVEITSVVTSAAATAAATAATDAALQVLAAPGEPLTIQQMQVTAQIAAQAAASSAAQTAADAKVTELIEKAPNDLVRQAILQMATPTVEAAASAAAGAAAASATAPTQPLDGLK